MPAPLADARSAATPFGYMLREWRAARRLSQLELALAGGVSARHLSFVETGRSQPSREFVDQMADVLEMPLRHRNALLLAAGYAPLYGETALDAPQMALIRQAIDLTLAQHEPFPAFVTNRYWDVLLTNRAAPALLAALKPGGPRHGNIVRQVFDPDDMRPHVDNWEEVAGDLLRHLHHEVARSPSDVRLRELLDEAVSYPGVPAHVSARDVAATPLPMVCTVFRRGEQRLRFFSTIARFGTSRDVTIEETSIECMHPMDEATRAYCHALAARRR